MECRRGVSFNESIVLHIRHKCNRARKVPIMSDADLAQLAVKCPYVKGRGHDLSSVLKLWQSFMQDEPLRPLTLMLLAIKRSDWKDHDMLEAPCVCPKMIAAFAACFFGRESVAVSAQLLRKSQPDLRRVPAREKVCDVIYIAEDRLVISKAITKVSTLRVGQDLAQKRVQWRTFVAALLSRNHGLDA